MQVYGPHGFTKSIAYKVKSLENIGRERQFAFLVNHFAQSVGSTATMKRAPKVMLLIESARAYERALLRGIAHYSHLQGPWIFFREAPFWEKRPHQALLAQLQAVDGIIMRECSYMSEIRQLRKPVIVSNYATPQFDGLSNFSSDNLAIGRMAADHLLERGFRHFAFCGNGVHH